jgi:hypothetical protein
MIQVGGEPHAKYYVLCSRLGAANLGLNVCSNVALQTWTIHSSTANT